MSLRLQILEYSYWEHYKYAKDLQYVLPIDHPKRVKIEKLLNEMITEINLMKTEMEKIKKQIE